MGFNEEEFDMTYSERHLRRLAAHKNKPVHIDNEEEYLFEVKGTAEIQAEESKRVRREYEESVAVERERQEKERQDEENSFYEEIIDDDILHLLY